MRALAVLVTAVLLSGCAHFYQEMTQEQQIERLKNIGLGVGAAAIGYALSDEADTIVTNNSYTTINECHQHGKHCK